ncbi:helix-turn-helix transcriptional regulator [Tsuneonella sp. HG094]
MAMTRIDRGELLLPLFAGLFDSPLWATFLRNLAARTGADRVHLVVRGPSVAAPRSHYRAGVDAAELSAAADEAAMEALPLEAMRPGRVYALGDLDVVAPSNERLGWARIGDARIVRVAGTSGHTAWLALFARDLRFGAADSVVLSDLVPAIATALENHVAVARLRERAEAAEVALARLGIHQTLVDSAFGQAEHADALFQPLESARRPFAVATGIATTRAKPGRLPANAPKIAARQFGLSAKEGALAIALAEGTPLIAAGRAIGLSEETTRNYSKRIYSKTGARGQADLVRIVLSSLAVLG